MNFLLYSVKYLTEYVQLASVPAPILPILPIL